MELWVHPRIVIFTSLALPEPMLSRPARFFLRHRQLEEELIFTSHGVTTIPIGMPVQAVGASASLLPGVALSIPIMCGVIHPALRPRRRAPGKISIATESGSAPTTRWLPSRVITAILPLEMELVFTTGK